VVTIPELHAEHQHGVWWDCVRAGPQRVISTIDHIYHESPLKCAHKFDEKAQAVMNEMWMNGEIAAKEMELHKLLPHHKAVIFFTIFVFVFGLISVIVGLCSPCFTPNALLFVVAIFLTGCCSALADLLFIFGAMRMDTRFATGIVSVNAQRIGYALHVHLCATGIFLLALLSSCIAAAVLIRDGNRRPSPTKCCLNSGDLETFHAEPYVRRPRVHRGCQAKNNNNSHCRTLVLLSEEEST